MQRNPEFAQLERIAGIYLHGAVDYVKSEWLTDFSLAMDAQPTLVSTPSSGIPAFLTTLVDPDVLRILTSPNKAAQILGEVRKGSWVDETIMFPVMENTGEVSTYGDFNNANGRAGVNIAFPQRQSYKYQTIINYGDLEVEREGLAKINYVQGLNKSSAQILDKFQNYTYFFGVAGIQNYGLLNDPSLPAPIAPAPKAAGGVKWFNGTVPNASANEIYADVQGLYAQLVSQGGGNIDDESPLVLVLSPKSKVGLKSTNQFGINVGALLKENFPNLRIESAVQYGAQSATNPQGNAAGEFMQLIATSIQGQDTGYCAFNEKMRTFPLFRDLSSWRQKQMGGTWGCILRQPFGVAGMIGI